MNIFKSKAIFIISILWVVSQFYVSYIRVIQPLPQRYLFVLASLTIILLCKPIFRKQKISLNLEIINLILSIVPILIGIHLTLSLDRILPRWPFISPVTTLDIICAMSLMILLLEATRRVIGLSLLIVAIIFITYGFIGPWLPGLLKHKGIFLIEMTEINLLSFSGTFGITAGVMVNYIFFFVLFGAFYSGAGGSEFFFSLSQKITKGQVAGPAKSAIVSSSLMGTVSGSAAANVTTTGVFTIPMMKRDGIPSYLAGAVEAVASTGGQLMPPVMGVSAFIIAEILGVKYLSVVKSAIFPALAYYVALFLYVHFDGLKKKSSFSNINDKIFNSQEEGSNENFIKFVHMGIPIVVLIYYIVIGYSVGFAVVRSIIAILIVSFLRSNTRISIHGFFNILVTASKNAATVAIPVYISGMIIGIVINSGLAMKFTQMLGDLGKGYLFPSLLLTAFACMILGMGLPTVAAYIMVSIFMAPILIKIGIIPMAAHLFIFYYAILAQITPPVAVTAYVAAGLAEADPLQTAWMAFKISIVAFLIPFVFVLDPSLLMLGSLSQVIQALISIIIGIVCFAAALTGFLFFPIKNIPRLFYALSAIILIYPSTLTDIFGISLMILAYVISRYKRKEPN